jgi:hypothetical protein
MRAPPSHPVGWTSLVIAANLVVILWLELGGHHVRARTDDARQPIETHAVTGAKGAVTGEHRTRSSHHAP